MDIIDIHAHLFSRGFFEALSGGDQETLVRVTRQAGIALPPGDVAAHTDRWLSEMDVHGVSRMVMFASVPEEIPAVRQVAARSGGRIAGCAFVNPQVQASVEAAADHHLCGVLLFPAMHHYHVAELKEMLEVLNARRAIVFVHCGLLVVKIRDLLGLPRPYDLTFANPLGIIPAANRFRRIRFVIPHFGAGFFREALMVGSQCENVYVDTSSSHSWMRTQPHTISLETVFARALDVFGAGRILFGTDSNVFPAGWRQDRLEEQMAVLDHLCVAETDKARVFGGNAAELLAEVV